MRTFRYVRLPTDIMMTRATTDKTSDLLDFIIGELRSKITEKHDERPSM